MSVDYSDKQVHLNSIRCFYASHSLFIWAAVQCILGAFWGTRCCVVLPTPQLHKPKIWTNSIQNRCPEHFVPSKNPWKSIKTDSYLTWTFFFFYVCYLRETFRKHPCWSCLKTLFKTALWPTLASSFNRQIQVILASVGTFCSRLSGFST